MPVLQFKGKTAVENHHWTVPHHVLEFDKKLSVLEKGQKPSLDGNLIIEGDNLLALKALLPTHAGRVKCIYIDPPYNTGNEGWVYNDNLTQPQFKEWIGQTVGKEGEDACRHDKWCCMMYPRLCLLKELLRDDGAIFISIDDNEVHHLRAMMDEIFGEENFVADIVWRNSTGPKQSKTLSNSHEYIVCYAKAVTNWHRNLLARTPEQEAGYQNPDNDPRGPWRSGGLDARNYYSKGRYPIICPGGRVIEGPPGDSYWRYPEETFWELDADNRIWWGEDGNNVPRVKRFLSEVQDGLVPQSFWDYDEVGHTQEAKQEYLRILQDQEVFTTPKPVALVKRVLQIATSKGDLILDSFAGSGTTAHATLELNAEDGGERKFLLVQLSCDTKDQSKSGVNIAESITRERVRRVQSGYTFTRRMGKGKSKRVSVPGLGGSFSYVKLGGRLLSDIRLFEEPLPSFEQLARYIYYTETSRDFDNKSLDPNTGRIGELKDTAYYLLYSNDDGRRQIDTVWLKQVAAQDACRKLVVYCEKIWLHRDELIAWETAAGKKVRTMLVPTQLK